MMKIGSLFSGVGGLELGLEWAGLGKTIWQVENNEFCQQILAKHWPEIERYGDIKTVNKTNLERVDLVCGGFPCQDVSAAGKGAGLSGARSGLWYEFLRVTKELRPRWVIVENVASGATKWVDQVRGQLELEGYATFPISLSAADCGAPHLRKRVFIVANTQNGRIKIKSKTDKRCDRSRNSKHEVWKWWKIEPDVDRVADGVPSRVDRLRGLGNAVVPQCAQVIGEIIKILNSK